MGLVAFFAAPVVLTVCWFILLFKKRREGLGIALFFFCAVLAAGVWSIRQSRARRPP